MPPGRQGPGSGGPGNTASRAASAGRMPAGPTPIGTRPPAKPSAPQSRAGKQASDYRLAYVASVAVAILVVGFVIGWAYLRPMQGHVETGIVFAKAGPFHIETDGFTYNATLAIQTDSSNARWARSNEEAINALLYRTLLGADPKTMRKPDGLVTMQKTLTGKINEAFGKARVQQILFTDFVLQSD